MEKIKIPLYKVLLMGDSGVGKTCILDSFLCDSFIENHDSTIGVDFKAKMIEINGTIIKLQLWDTAGQERFRNVTTAYYHEAKGIILVYDVTNEKSFDNIINWLSLVNDRAPADVKKILLGTKCDIENKRKVPKERGEQLAVKYKMKFLETSSKMNINIEEAFFLLARDIYIAENEDIVLNTSTNDRNILLQSSSKKKKKEMFSMLYTVLINVN
ncbi:ras-related protein Rab-13-like [Aphidius gifuensis]|uniref:ras-related protein Rab-13-like n=1 Tax=Aphidius gifuensis TaxID=684658 RepID=UPI001CDB8535|nr:ras-related protein Rab-13-like [Aphidius gifuensis]